MGVLIIAGLLLNSTAIAYIDLNGKDWDVTMIDNNALSIEEEWDIVMSDSSIGNVSSYLYGPGGITSRLGFLGRQRVLLNFPDDFMIFIGFVPSNAQESRVIYGVFVNYITFYRGTFVAVPSAIP
jgi:hypothetical protein